MALYCANCGKQLVEDARYCSWCGQAVGGSPPRRAPKLIRPRQGRKIAGVCQGFADRMDWDVTLIRIIFAVLGIITFPVWDVIYLVCWIAMPNEPAVPLAPGFVSGQTGAPNGA